MNTTFYFSIKSIVEKPILTSDEKRLIAQDSFILSSSTKEKLFSVTNHCETGSHGCDKNTRCIPTPSRSDYQCQCKAKYEMRNGKCHKSRKLQKSIMQY